ncbi:MAG: shikimate kinase [Alphaproteobacteria bacterium]|nr:shikimate kinase [Alphaproteobacteria bacterium]
MSAPQPTAATAPCPWLGRTVVLVGLMGAGKSSIGLRLAGELGLPFFDADAEIEAAAGSTIEEFFERHGEPAFREGERRVMARLLDGPRAVIASGGGAFMDPSTRALIRERAISVWLRAELDVLLKRTGRRNNRPLLKKEDPAVVLARLIEQRYPIYAAVDITVDSRADATEETLADVMQKLKALQLQSGDGTA